MSNYDKNTPEEDSVQLENRYTVTVQITVKADSANDAEEEVKNLIQEGIVTLLDNQDRELVCDYDIVESEPAEIEL